MRVHMPGLAFPVSRRYKRKMEEGRDIGTVRIVIAGMLFATTGCEPDAQTLRITAQDFQFTPAEVHLTSAKPTHLTIVNEGREPHIFESVVLVHRLGNPGEITTSVRIAPNERTDMIIQPIPGTYIFHCKIRGHAGMNGTIIVD